jgi:trypsin-like peptidase
MGAAYRAKLRLIIALLAAISLHAGAQAPEVPIYRQGRRESQYADGISEATKQLFDGGQVLKLAAVKEQLKRTSCKLDLPKPSTAKLDARQICDAARQSHLRVGWAFVCTNCDQWHVNLAGGYVLTTNGAVATCYHVIKPGHEIKDGCLVAADESGKVLPVTEILAANRYSDACIVQVRGEALIPLPLNTNVYPGDSAFCYSDPLDHRGYFSQGIVNRFYQFPGRRAFSAPPAAAFAPTRLDVGTAWAPGSSGSAVLDACANAIGHVSTIAVIGDPDTADIDEPRSEPSVMIVFHEAVSARDVLQLVGPRN